MSATSAWSYTLWLAGLLLGVALANENTPQIIAGIAMTLIAGCALHRFGEHSQKDRAAGRRPRKDPQ